MNRVLLPDSACYCFFLAKRVAPWGEAAWSKGSGVYDSSDAAALQRATACGVAARPGVPSTPGSLSAVGSGTCGPDRALCCTGSDSDVLVSSQGGAGAGWRLAGGRTPRRRCLNSVASVRRPTEWETPPLHHSRQRQGRPMNWPGQAGREIGRSAGFGRCAATGSNHVAVFAVARLPPDQVRYAWVPTTMYRRGQADC